LSDQSDIAEIECLYREHGPALVLFASAIAGESSRAQDVVQQVFLKLIRDGSLKGVTEKRAYVFACVRNTMLNEVKGRWRGVSLDPGTAWFDPPLRDYAAESNLRQSLVALPEDQRQVVVLHVWGELTFSEIADVLNVSPNTAASRYRYALAKLRDSMRGKAETHAKGKGEIS
jgi:RNA polymerase sigma-70 factor (ECF subfamily)